MIVVRKNVVSMVMLVHVKLFNGNVEMPKKYARLEIDVVAYILLSDLSQISIIIIILARTPEIGQGLGRILSYGARKPVQT